MDCPPVRGDNPLALASGLSPVHVNNHSITILYYVHQCVDLAHFEIFRAKVGRGSVNYCMRRMGYGINTRGPST